MKKWSQKIEMFTDTQYGLTASQLLGSMIIAGALIGLLNVIQIAGHNLLGM